MFSIKESISKNFEKKYKQKDFYDRFVTLFLVSIPVSIGCLVWSFFPSYNFYLAYFRPFQDPFWNMFLATFLSVSQSVMIGVISQSIRNDIFRNQVSKVTGLLAVVNILLMVWNGGVDWYGSPELASSMFNAPIDQSTPKVDATYELQVSNLAGTKKSIEDRIKYIKGDCKKDDCYVTGGKAYWKGSPTPYQQKELRRLAEELESAASDITSKQNEWNTKKEESQSKFSAVFQTYENRVNRRTGVLRGFVFGLMIIFALCEYWKGFFGLQVGNGASAPVKKKPEISNKKHSKKRKNKKPEKTVKGKNKKSKTGKKSDSKIGPNVEDIEEMLEKLWEKKQSSTAHANGKFKGYESMGKPNKQKPEKDEGNDDILPSEKTDSKILFSASNQPQKNTGKKERTKRAIIKAISDLNQKGEKPTSGKIAKRVGVTPRTVRNYLKEINVKK